MPVASGIGATIRKQNIALHVLGATLLTYGIACSHENLNLEESRRCATVLPLEQRPQDPAKDQLQLRLCDGEHGKSASE